MSKQISSPHQFQNMISEFCVKRIKPHVPDELLNKISSYFKDLIVNHRNPPMRRSQIDWLSLASESRIDCELTDRLKTTIRPALESIIRWVGSGTPQQNQITPKRTMRERRALVHGNVSGFNKCIELDGIGWFWLFPDPAYALQT